MEKTHHLLWVDDQINELQPYVRALRESGFDVMAADSSPVAIQLASDTRFDVILVDILMPPPDGIELLRRLRPLQPQASLAALSSYLYLERYREQLRGLPFPVELIEKDIPNVEAEDFDMRFLTPIRNLLAHGVTQTIKKQDSQIRSSSQTEASVNPFDIPLTEFMKKPILEKDSLVMRARELAANEIEAAFNQGKIWVLLCGSPRQIRASASTPDEVLSEDKIMEFARVQQRPAFQFWRPMVVDDIHWPTCGDERTTKHYPTVTLDIRNNLRNFHFDTGAPMTFFSYEELVRLSLIKPTTNFGMASRGDKSYFTTPLNITVILRSQSGDNSKTVNLTGQAVRDWDKAPYARFCDSLCPLFTPLRDQLCNSRAGLIGRNLLYENNLVIILDGANQQTLLGD